MKKNITLFTVLLIGISLSTVLFYSVSSYQENRINDYFNYNSNSRLNSFKNAFNSELLPAPDGADTINI